MSAVWLRLRAELRQRAVAFVALGILAGIAAGVVLTAAAGARRTASGLARVDRHDRVADVLANPDSGDMTGWQRFAKLPNVESSSLVEGVALLGVANGHLDERYLGFEIMAPTDRGLFHSIEKQHMIEGRAANPDAPDEVVVNERLARRGFTVGHTFTLQAFTQTEVQQLYDNKSPHGHPVHLRVVGVMVPLDEVVRAPDDPRISPTMLATPALLRTSHVGYLYGGLYVRFKHGAADLPAWEHTVQSNVHGNVNFQERASTDTRVERAVGPYVFALWGFAILAAVVGGVVVAQTLARQHAADAGDHPTLTGLGFVRSDFGVLGALRGLVIGVIAAITALVVAYFASVLMPIGPLRHVEPVSGRQVDLLVFVLGALLVVAGITAHGAVSYLRNPGARRTRQLREVAVPMPPAVSTGFRFAFDRGHARAPIPLRSTLLGVTVAVAALVASLVYANALGRFTSTPRLFGWVWSYQVEPDSMHAADVAHQLAKLHDITYTQGAYGQLLFGKRSVPAIAVAPKRGMQTVDVVKGRAPVDDHEIALGRNTMSALHVGIGDVVHIRGVKGPVSARVVGQAVFARFAPYPASDATGLGTGAAVTLHAFRQYERPSDNDPTSIGAGSPFFLVDVHRGSGLEQRDVRDAVFGPNGRNDPNALVLAAQRPNDVLSYSNLRRTPLGLALLLVLLGAATTVHLLVTGVRRRRRDLGLLKAVGCTTRQLLTVILVQATTLIGVALLVALPAGVLVGRFAWLVTARWLGIPARAVVPVAAVVAVGAIGLAVANLVAFWPGLRAGRIRPALALRTE